MTIKFKACAALGCANNADRSADGKRGYCCKHYQRIRKFGDPHVVNKTPSPAQDWLDAHKTYDGDDCLKWPFSIGKDGYGRAHARGGTLTTASRLMCLNAHGAPPSPNHEAAHSCGHGNQACVNPKHLYWATPTTNQRDRATHGTTNRGSRQGSSKLTEADVTHIREMIGKHSQKVIAAQFGVKPHAISSIKIGRRWAWLKT